MATAFWNSLYREVLAGRGRYMKGKHMPTIFWIWEGRYFGQWQLGAKNHYISWNGGVQVPFTVPKTPRDEAASDMCKKYSSFINNLQAKLMNEEWESYWEGERVTVGRRTWEILGRPKIDKWIALEFQRMEENTKLGLNNMIRLGKLVLKHRSYLKGMKEFFWGYTQACFLNTPTPEEIADIKRANALQEQINAHSVFKIPKSTIPEFVTRSFTDDHYRIMQKGILIGNPRLDWLSSNGDRWSAKACGGVKIWRAFYHKKANDVQKDAWVILLKLSKIELRQADKVWVDEVVAKFQRDGHIGLLTKVHDRAALMERQYQATLSVHPGMIEYHAKFKEECKWTFPEGMTLLSTIEEYAEEGASMQHCVAGYFNQCSHIVSIRTEEGASTLELGPTGLNRQHRGYLNKAPPAANVELVRKFYSMLLAKQQHPDQLTTEATTTPFPIGEEGFDI